MKGKRQEAKGKRQKWKTTTRGPRVLHFYPLSFASCLLPSLEMCLSFDVRHSPDEINLVSLKRAPELVLPRRARAAGRGRLLRGEFQRTSRASFREHKRFNVPLEAADARRARGEVGGGALKLPGRGRGRGGRRTPDARRH